MPGMMMKFAKRAGLAMAALSGQLDGGLNSLVEASSDRGRCDRLKIAMMSLENERNYWYNLWRSTGLGHEAAQSMMVDEIDKLRQQLGTHDGVPWVDAVKGFHEKYVDPKHPAEIEGVTLDVPPKPVAVEPAKAKQSKAKPHA